MMEDFSGLALPPLFGGHILEAELETGGVELGPSGTELLDSDGAPSGPAQDGEDERRGFLMKTLDSYGDDYRTAQLTITLEDEGKAGLDSAVGADEDSCSPTCPHQSAAGPKKKRHRVPKDRERDAQMESEHPLVTEGQFTGFPSPSSPSH
ncbi:TCF3 fusion partner-like [Sinocyclocheilus rhinocerous]|uniref:TCF3 fusion partner-like n=1 Tax=Sinocyclocheilus rhinocerous TaxID=307959 RepID=UPI0007B81952|nr:PREDICTED: TCF3 fusion partner-like [Sinocyclocheilus rhinocerous]